MKKSDMTVSMPLTAYMEYEEMKRRLDGLATRLRGCFDDSLYRTKASPSVSFDACKALEVCREYLPYSLGDADIEIVATRP